MQENTAVPWLGVLLKRNFTNTKFETNTGQVVYTCLLNDYLVVVTQPKAPSSSVYCYIFSCLFVFLSVATHPNLIAFLLSLLKSAVDYWLFSDQLYIDQSKLRLVREIQYTFPIKQYKYRVTFSVHGLPNLKPNFLFCVLLMVGDGF